MVTAKLNLSGLKHVIREMDSSVEKGKKVKGIFIPIEANHLFLSEKGNTYLELICFEMKEKKDYGTHIIKQSLPKDVREAMTDDQKKDMPILGNLNVDNTPQEASDNVESDDKSVDKENVPF